MPTRALPRATYILRARVSDIEWTHLRYAYAELAVCRANAERLTERRYVRVEVIHRVTSHVVHAATMRAIGP